MMFDLMLLALLIVCAVTAIEAKDLLGSIMLLSIYSLLMAIVWTRLNAVDVAFTEISVGAGITTVLMLAAMSRIGRWENRRQRPWFASIPPVLVVALVMIMLLYGTLDMPAFGDPQNPPQVHVAPRYIEQTPHEIGVPNFVAAILAAYRGYDTLGETTVIFTAGICVIMLLRRAKNKQG